MTAVMAEAKIGEREVLDYLRRHPDLLARHPDLLATLTLPGRDLGDGIADFQQFQLKNLQANAGALKLRYDGLVDFCRDNLSVQTQVHDAVLRLIRARGLGSLLEALTLDLVSLFDVDVVRLAVESDAGLEVPLSGAAPHSGIILVPPGTVAETLGGRKARLVEDAEGQDIPGFEDIFSDCAELARSFALLALELEGAQRGALLAFGVRHPGRFQANQGVEMLSFLARIVACQLDVHLSDLDL